jgi:CBS domain containing-hemolysin-like protein
MITYVLLRVLAVVLLVAANAFFVAAEFALVSVRDTRIQQLIEAQRVGARTVRKLHEHLNDVLNAVQFGITLASLGLGWVGEVSFAHAIESSLVGVPHAAVYAHGVAIVVAFSIITYMHVILGEVVPKSVALQRAERVALAVARPLDVFMTIARPLLVVMGKSGRFVLRLVGAEATPGAGVHSPEELKMIISASRRLGLLPELQESMILRALEMGEVTVREIMVPRTRIFSLPADMPLAQALARVVEEQHSRVPVFDPQRGPEHIIGLLYSKDLSRWMHLRLSLPADDPRAAQLPRMQVRDIMRGVLVVPETKPLPDLLVEFKERKRHLAVVVDEFGSTAGVVTVEDVLEQIVGEIEDEFDIAPKPLPPGTTMVLEGGVNIRDLETQYRLSLPRDQGFETLAGFVLAQMQRIPILGDNFEFDGRRYTVIEMDGLRVARVKIEQLQPVAE